jgi:predicted Fe-Mo cluster-binding NifX family protein
MKLAITSAGNNLQSTIDSRFGRCAYFVLYDTAVRSVEFLPNVHKDALDGAGPAAVQEIASRGVNQIISGEFGIKIKPLLDSLKIQMIIIKEPEKTIQDIIDLINNRTHE